MPAQTDGHPPSPSTSNRQIGVEYTLSAFGLPAPKKACNLGCRVVFSVTTSFTHSSLPSERLPRAGNRSVDYLIRQFYVRGFSWFIARSVQTLRITRFSIHDLEALGQKRFTKRGFHLENLRGEPGGYSYREGGAEGGGALGPMPSVPSASSVPLRPPRGRARASWQQWRTCYASSGLFVVRYCICMPGQSTTFTSGLSGCEPAPPDLSC